ncbi:MAG: hypothetical protein ACHQ49_11095 [Elusimicrobiota bacterium]
MKTSFIVAAVLAALCAGTVMADEIDAQVAAALTATKAQAAAQKLASAQVTEQQHRQPQHREPQHREPQHDRRGPEHRRGRWEHGRDPRHGWRPAHWSRYLGYSYDMSECQAFGRAEGFPFVTRYNFSGDCYGDYRPY